MVLTSAFILGLFGSLHCVGMCGPIAMALPLTASEKWTVAVQSLLYQTGRVATYGMMGLVMGFTGWGIALSGYQNIVSIVLGATLILSALFSFSIEKRFMAHPIIHKFYDFLKTRLSGLLAISNRSHAFRIGLLNGFLPCGLVYVALAGAVVTGGVVQGTLYMIAFGLGTIPLMSAVMFFGKFGQKYVFRLRKFIPVLLVLFGIYLIYRGLMIDIPADAAEMRDMPH